MRSALFLSYIYVCAHGFRLSSRLLSRPFRSIKEIQMSSEEEYPMNPFDAYPISASDDEVLDALRQENQIANDLWQSTHFRDKHYGEWIGRYELLFPDLSKQEFALYCSASGNIKSIISSPQVTKDEELASGGVSITTIEEYTGLLASTLYANDNRLQELSNLLMQPTRAESISTDFRLSCGNQAVGGAYTLVRGYDGNSPSMYLAEVVVHKIISFFFLSLSRFFIFLNIDSFYYNQEHRPLISLKL